MAEIKKRNLVLTFSNLAGGEEKITINSPKENLTSEAIATAMEAIIDAKAIGKDQLVTNKVKAEYVIQQVEAVEIED